MLTRRSFLAQAGLVAFAWQTGLLRALENSAPVTVRTPNGALEGEQMGGVRIFRGVPFAQPPVGPLRFLPPEPLKPWTGLRQAMHFGPAAMQPGKFPSLGEDCLYLNVWAPEGKGPFPVYVWIHGGGFTAGSTHDPMYDGAKLAAEGVVCVTVAYRLGIFGFLNLGPLLGPSYAGSANNGVRDLMAALGWVRENIEAFGGDPSRVTVGGQSAGAKLTGILMGVPAARGLFHQMVSESGGAERVASREESEHVAESFGAEWKAKNGSLRELLTAPAGKLVEAQEHFSDNCPKHFPLRAQVDGKLLKRMPVKTIAKGATRGKRLLIGTNRDESAAFIGPHPVKDPGPSDLGNMSAGAFLDVYREYKKIYPQMSDAERRIRALTAEEYWIPSVREAEAHVKGGGKAWVYRMDFSDATGSLRGFAPHSLELKLVWNRPSALAANAAEEARMAQMMHHAWLAFLKGEPPAAKGLPAWPDYTEKKRATMLLDVESRVEERPCEAERRLWEKMLRP